MLVDLEGHCQNFDDEHPTEFMKIEPSRSDNEFLEDHDYLSDQFNHPMLPLSVIARKQKLIWKKKSVSSPHNTFRSTWSRALENADSTQTAMYKNPDENVERKPKRNEEIGHMKRTNESKQDRQDRLYKNAVRVALRRSLESEEQIRERRLKNALRAAYRRSIETPEQRAERRRKDLLRSARRRREETELQSKIRKYNDAVRAAFRRRNETPEQRAQRKMIDVLRAARRRSEETPEQREARLKADRERAAKRRFFKKLKILDPEVPAHREMRYFNVTKEEADQAFRDASETETVLEDVDVIFSNKAKLFAEHKNIQSQSESKHSQTIYAFKEPSFADVNVNPAINSEYWDSSSRPARGIEEIHRSVHSAFNRFKKSEIVW